MKGYTAWDIEIAVPLQGYNLGDQDVGISCASAVVVGDGTRVEKVWRANDVSSRMDRVDCMEMVTFLSVWSKRGFPVVTFNGLGFDFQVLAREFDRGSFWWLTVAGLAYEHVDIYYQFLKDKGHRVGLAALAEAVGASGKTEGMHGGLAPLLWSEGLAMGNEESAAIAALGLTPGSAEARDFVCEYVLQDSIATGELYEGILRNAADGIAWKTKSGSRATRPWKPSVKSNGDLYTVHECITKLRSPDQSWQTDPPSLSDPYGWIGYEYDQIEDMIEKAVY